jgi:1,4-alpha-glucan branching enzyme
MKAKNSTILIILSLIFVQISIAQNSLNVIFRYIQKPGENFIRIFVPGTMPPGSSSDWGPNSSGFINPSAPSIMTFDPSIDAYEKSYQLTIGKQYEYKIHFHFDQSGSNWQWNSDPLNPFTTGSNNNSLVTVADPLIFQPTGHLTSSGFYEALSAGIFTNKNVSKITYIIGQDTLDGIANLNPEGIFFAPISPPKNRFERYLITAEIGGQEYIILDQAAIDFVEEVRPANTKHGLNISGNIATFVIHAPKQPVMQIIVGKLGETLTDSNSLVLKKAIAETDIWWLDLELEPGEYEYKYLLLDGRKVSDPFSRRVINDKTVFEIGPGGISTADDYVWKSDNYNKPALDTLVIYELHVNDFAAKGNGLGRFTDLTNKLDYLDSLGINGIELMPIMEFPTWRYWGYLTSHHVAIEDIYGTPREFKQFIDESHKRGIAVILDVVFNQFVDSSPLWQIQPDVNLNPYFKSGNDLRPNETAESYGGLDFDHFSLETQLYVKEVIRIWVEEYRIDGFRFDFTRGIGWDPNQPQSGILGWSNYLEKLDPTVYQIVEHLPGDPALVNNYTLDAGWHDSFHDRLLDDIRGSKPSLFNVSTIILGLFEYGTNLPSYQNRTQTVKSTVTHDEQSFIQEMVEWQGVPLEAALKRDLFYSTLTFTSLGIPLLWQAQELGMQSGWLDINQNGNWDEEKLRYRPMDWSLVNTDRGKRHFNLYKNLISLRKKNPALWRGNYYDLWRYENKRVIVYGFSDETLETKGDEVVVVANFSDQEQVISEVPWLSQGSWINAIETDSILNVTTEKLVQFTAPAYTASVYYKDVETSVESELSLIPSTFSLEQNYPNPFNPTTRIEFSLPTQEFVELKIYSVQGKEIETIVSNKLAAGIHQFSWNATSVPSGVYFYKLKAGNFKETKKMLLIE